jgi:hypothetical protein
LEFNAPFLPPFVQSVEVGLEDLLGFVRVFGRRVNCDVVCIRLSLDSWGGGFGRSLIMTLRGRGLVLLLVGLL